MVYSASFSLILVACFVAQSLALKVCGGRTQKGESNYFSSLARIQEGSRNEPQVMLLGSSRTGRLPDRANGVVGVANLGCDGASAVVSLRAMVRGEILAAPTVLIEGNTLYKAATDPDPGLARAMESPWFRVGERWRSLSATARPSSILYSYLLMRRHGYAEVSKDPGKPLTKPSLIREPGLRPLDKTEERLVDELVGAIRSIREGGAKVLIYDLPPAAPDESANARVAKALASRSGTLHWDLSTALSADEFQTTDGFHLDPSSAARVMKLLLNEVEQW